MRKFRWLAGIIAFCVVLNAFAFLQFVTPVTTGVMWLGRVMAGNITMARAMELSITAHGAAGWAWYVWKNQDDTTPQTSTPIKARLYVSPSPTSKRANPDPTKFDDATTTRDPTPKPTYPHSPPAPGNGSLAAIANAGVGSYSYSSNGGSTITEYHVIQTYQSGMSQAQADSAAKAATQDAHVGWNWSGGYYITANDWRAIWYRTVSNPSCPAGYSYSAGQCNLTDASKVMKPAGRVPCEVLANSDGTWDIDSKNPECNAIASQLIRSGKKLYVAKGDGTYDGIENKEDGGTTITTGNRTIDMGPPDSEGRQTIRGITDSGPGSSPGGGTGNTGAGGTGSGTGNCGGPGQSPCAVTVDDSGFQGKDAAINAAADSINARLDERRAFIESKGNDSSNFGLDKTWIPSFLPGSPVSCRPIKWEPRVSHGPLSGLAASLDIDWCDNLDVFRQYYAWLFGVVTAWAIAMLFFGSNGNTGRAGK